MAVIASGKIVALAQAKDPKAALIKEVGDISGVQVLGANLFVATYIRPEKIGNIIRPESNIKEDEFQGNLGLVLKYGSDFNEDDRFPADILHAWVMFGYNDGLKCRYNDVPCRIISIDRIRAVIPDPTKVL